MKIFEHQIRVSAQDIDELNHVNNVRYLKWIQDIAEAHWLSVAPKEMQAQCMWVVLRHEIDYLNAALLGDTLKVKTWVGKSEGVKSERHVEITNLASGKLACAAKTTWCLLDAATKRPKRVQGVVDVFV